MGYKNNQTGYPQDLLATRAIVKKGNFALIPQGGLVKNVIPGFEGCMATILASSKMGATFVDYVVEVTPEGGNRQGFGGCGVESFLYVLQGEVQASVGADERLLTTGGYVFCPPDQTLRFVNPGSTSAQIFLYKRRYKKAADVALPAAVFGEISRDAKPYYYEDMENVFIQDLLPKDLAYDMNMHILTFQPGASHGYIETHVQEHGALVLTGQGMYNLDNNWVPVQTGDYMFMGAYSPQAAYGVGSEAFAYLYSKDCNRDEEI